MNYPEFYPFSEISFKIIEVVTSTLSGEIVVYGTRPGYVVVPGQTFWSEVDYVVATGNLIYPILEEEDMPQDVTATEVDTFTEEIRAHHARRLGTAPWVDIDLSKHNFDDNAFQQWLNAE